MANRDGVRTAPHSRDAERAVLGCVILDNALWDRVREQLAPHDFLIEGNKLVFEAMSRIAFDGSPLDPVTIGEFLSRNGVLEKMGPGGIELIGGLTDAVGSTQAIDRYVGIVLEKSGLRDVIRSSERVIRESYEDGDPERVRDLSEDVIAATAKLTRNRIPRTMAAIGDAVKEQYEAAVRGRKGIPFPWQSMTNMTGGMWPGTVTLFVARPASGKSFSAILIARHAWREQNRVLIVSPEMSATEIGERFYAIDAGVDYDHVIKGKLSDVAVADDSELDRFYRSMKRAKTSDDLWILDGEDDLTFAGIEASVRAVRPALVVVDALYMLHVRGERRDRAVASLEWMVRAAKRLGVPMVGFAQLNRTAEQSEKKGGGARLGTIALGDEFGQDAHSIFALDPTKDDLADRNMRWKALKLRRGFAAQKEILTRWDFSTMQTDEIEDHRKGKRGKGKNDDVDWGGEDPIPF